MNKGRLGTKMNSDERNNIINTQIKKIKLFPNMKK